MGNLELCAPENISELIFEVASEEVPKVIPLELSPEMRIPEAGMPEDLLENIPEDVTEVGTPGLSPEVNATERISPEVDIPEGTPDEVLLGPG